MGNEKDSEVSAGDEPRFDDESVNLENLPPHSPVIQQALRYQFIISVVGYIIGGIAVLAGILIFALGMSESVEWEFEGLGVTSQVQTSAVGLLISVIGAAVIWASRLQFSATAGSSSLDGQ